MYDPDDIEVGKRYQVQAIDCCVAFSFTAMLTHKEDGRLLFDNGVEITRWGAITTDPEVVEAEVVSSET